MAGSCKDGNSIRNAAEFELRAQEIVLKDACHFFFLHNVTSRRTTGVTRAPRWRNFRSNFRSFWVLFQRPAHNDHHVHDDALMGKEEDVTEAILLASSAADSVSNHLYSLTSRLASKSECGCSFFPTGRDTSASRHAVQ